MQEKFYNAILKYGWNNFEHSILEEKLTLEEALLKEAYYIDFFDAINNGYNVSTGGGTGFLKRVRCITTDKIFDSVEEAANYANISSSTLSHCLHGDWNTSGEIENVRLEWCFLIDYYNQDKINKNKIKQEKIEIMNKEKEEFKKLFLEGNTITNIGKKFNRSKKYVSDALKELGIEVLPSSEAKRKKIIKLDKNYNELEFFASATEALKSVGKTDSDCSRLKKACEEGWRIYKGYHWKYDT